MTTTSELILTDGADVRDASEALSRVAVRPPYVALRDLDSAGPGSLVATVEPEQASDVEVGPLTAAEAGRHLATLGALAAASVNPNEGQHYYLARQWSLQRHDAVPDVSRPARRLLASAAADCERTGSANAGAALHAADGTTLFSLEIDYQVVPARLFERVYRSRRDAGDGVAALRPHATPAPFEILCRNERGVDARVDVAPARCAGHYPRFPAVPLATLVEAASRAAGSVMQSRLRRPDLRYAVCAVDVESDDLAFAGEPVDLRVRYVRRADRSRFFTGSVRDASRRSIAEIDLELRPES